MLHPQSLERATLGYRAGYRDGYAANIAKDVDTNTIYGADYVDGYRAGVNDKRWDSKLAETR